MLSSVLSSQEAISVNTQIVRVFTRSKKLLNEHSELKIEIADIKKKLNNQDKNHDRFITIKKRTENLINFNIKI